MAMDEKEHEAFLNASMTCDTPEELWIACSKWKDEQIGIYVNHNELKVVVSGPTCSGKSTIASAIAEFLHGRGVWVTVTDPDLHTSYEVAMKAENLDYIAPHTKVDIESVVTLREHPKRFGE